MDLINRDITPDPFNPQRGDVYEYDSDLEIRTRIVICGTTPAITLGSTLISAGLSYVANGASRSCALDDFAIFVASLSNMEAIGRVSAATVQE